MTWVILSSSNLGLIAVEEDGKSVESARLGVAVEELEPSDSGLYSTPLAESKMALAWNTLVSNKNGISWPVQLGNGN